MRILVSTSTFPRYEGDRVTPFMADLVSALVLRGIEVDVLAPHAPGSRTEERISNGATVYRFRYAWPEAAEDICYGAGALENLRSRPLRVLKLPMLIAAQALAARHLARQRQYDVIHAHWLLPQGLSALRAISGKTPVIVTAHGSDVLGLPSTWAMRAKRIVVRNASRLTANTSATAEALFALGARANRVEIVRIGASPKFALDRSTERAMERPMGNRPHMLFVGRLIALKGVDLAIRALSQLLRYRPEAMLTIIGDGHLRQELAELADSLGAGNRVHFAGWLQPEEVAGAMRNADVLVAPSRTMSDGSTEAQGVVPIEAMLMELPVIASRVGGLKEIVQDGVTGLLVDENAPHAIAKAVLRLDEDRTYAAQIKRQAQCWAVSEGLMTRTAERYHEIYQDVLAQRRN